MRQRENSYSHHLLGNDSPVSELSVLDIGAGFSHPWGSPLVDGLRSRQAKTIKYVGIDLDRGERDVLRASGRAVCLDHVRDFFAKGKARTSSRDSIDQLKMVWDARNLQYPFDDCVFDEAHCHMIVSNVVGYRPSRQMDSYVAELDRLIKPRGKFFLSAQVGSPFFFGDPDRIQDFVAGAEAFTDAMSQKGFSPELISYSKERVLRFVPGLVPHIRHAAQDTNEVDARIFSNYNGYADTLLIYKKN